MGNDFFDLDHLKKTYFKMAIPVVLGLVVTLVYNLADTYFVAITGDTNLVAALIMSISRQGVVYILALIIMGSIFGYTGIIASQLVADVLSAVIGLVLYKTNKKTA